MDTPETEQALSALIDDVTGSVDVVARQDAIDAKPIDKLRQHASVQVSEDELWTPEGQAKLARKEAAALRLEEMEPQLREEEARAKQVAEQASFEQRKAQRVSEIAQFAEVNPDLTTYKPKMMELIEAEGISWKDAYYRAKAEAQAEELATLRAQLDEQRKSRRSDAMSIGTGSSSGLKPTPNKKLTLEELYISLARQKGIPV